MEERKVFSAEELAKAEISGYVRGEFFAGVWRDGGPMEGKEAEAVLNCFYPWRGNKKGGKK